MVQKKSQSTKRLTILFFLFQSIIASILIGTIWPHLKINAYIPFLIILMLSSTFGKAMWMSCFSGIILDLISSNNFGIHALNFTLITFFLYRYNRFFNDRPINICFYTILASMTSTLIYFFLYFIFKNAFSISIKWIFTDLLFMSIIDGIYAFIWFSCPIIVFQVINNTFTKIKYTKNRRSYR